MKLIFSPLLVFLLFASCKDQCINENQIFNQYIPDSEEYKLELADIIQNTNEDNIQFYIGNYLSQDDSEYLKVHVKGKNVCAEMLLCVEDWHTIHQLRKQESGYSGAELAGLKIDIRTSPGKTSFWFQSVNHIVD